MSTARKRIILSAMLALLAVWPAAARGTRGAPLAFVEPGRVRAVAPERAPVLLAQRLEPSRGELATLDSEHFEIVYSPERLSRTQAEEARRLAEAAWAHCEKRFQSQLTGKVRLDLTPNFEGATGFARPGDLNDQDPRRRPMVGVRFADLDYLGLPAAYVLTHEVAHLFSGKLAGSSLGEGIADWGAAEFTEMPMRPWWGKALRDAGLWIDPEAFFITGEFEARPEVDATIRTAQYVESGLLVRFLVEKFGWEKFRAFAEDYGAARGRLNSNEDRRNLRLPRNYRPRPGRPDPRQAPDAAQVRAVFEKHFGQSWGILRSEWERQIAADQAEPGQAERLVLRQQLYGAVRNYEMWALDQRPAPSSAVRAAVREVFTRANRLLSAGDVSGAQRALAEARLLMERLRRPNAVA